MKFVLEEHHRNVSDEELIADLIRVATILKKDKVTIDEYNQLGIFHHSTFARRFGTWLKSLEKAGLQKTRNLHISNEELFENVVEMWTLLGRQPKYKDCANGHSKYSAGTYEKRFSSWRKALETFVLWVNEGDVQVGVPHKEMVCTKQRTSRQINWRLRAMVLMKDGARCKLSGSTPQDGIKLHVDHITPWANGGETVFENLQILCEKCNVGKSNIDPHSL